ncbi:2-hydroxyacid dehydrogenase [Rhizobium halophytocola]|uniref:Glyoxylate/hydroxypyruvate reductase A n=1 Tax=Rhizobium halophytocola TaxID=735519 RepID=A0ABS4E196_9HYPH|nr:glyoxylate/hydroxypyruvate reductase A [Rhizobium halophytocola]MBP1851718.1 glyoxylate/hydroxypyruvate reductase A [Rhizobium halophytocola]
MSAGSIVVDLKFAPESVAAALKDGFAGREVINMADPENRDRDLSGCAYAVVWKPDPSLFDRARNLKVIISGGAGVDHILASYELPDTPIVRFVDRSLTDRMSEWVVLQSLIHLRQVPVFARQQREHLWEPRDSHPEAADVTVGVMGLGVLGADAAKKLKVMGFDVIGWSRSAKRIEGIETFDATGLETFLGRTDILVGLLPLTDDTRGLFNADLFAGLRQGGALAAGRPVFLNAGRGGSQVETDIVAALENGVLGGASLDVFQTEPLSADSPLWGMENVILTPHVAAMSDTRAVFRHAERQIARFERGEPLEHVVDRNRGY